MKGASKLFYTIGLVFNIIGLVFTVIFTIGGALAINNADIIAKVAADSNRTVAFVHQVVLVFLIFCSIDAAIQIAILILTIRGIKNINAGNGRVATHILLLILGIFGVNIFYLLGGIFALASANQEE